MRDSRSDYVYGFHLHNIIRRIKHIQDEYLIPYDITPQQARLVGHISINQKYGQDLCQKDIEIAMGIKGSSVTSLLKGLERKGFIVRNTGALDGRTKELSLTSKGQSLVDTFDEVFRETEEKITQGMTEEQKNTFLQLLQMVIHNLES